MPAMSAIACAVSISLYLNILVGEGVAGASPGAQADPRVAITTFTTHRVSPGDRRLLSRSLGGGLSGAGLQVLPAARVRQAFARHPALVGCETTVCLARVGAILRAPLTARAVVEDTGGGIFRLALTLTATRGGRRVSGGVRRCAPCTTAEAAEIFSRLAREAGRQAAEKLRTTRAPRRTSARRRRVAPRRGNGLRGDPDGQAAWRRRNRALVIAGFALLGAGIVGLTSGGVLVGLDGTKTTLGCATGYNRCQRDTRAGGITAVALGSAAAATGLSLLLYRLLAGRKPAVTVAVDPIRRALLVRGRF